MPSPRTKVTWKCKLYLCYTRLLLPRNENGFECSVLFSIICSRDEPHSVHPYRELQNTPYTWIFHNIQKLKAFLEHSCIIPSARNAVALPPRPPSRGWPTFKRILITLQRDTLRDNTETLTLSPVTNITSLIGRHAVEQANPATIHKLGAKNDDGNILTRENSGLPPKYPISLATLPRNCAEEAEALSIFHGQPRRGGERSHKNEAIVSRREVAIA